MSKTKSESAAIEVGKPIRIDGATRAEVADKLKALKAQAKGMKAQGGFIEYGNTKRSEFSYLYFRHHCREIQGNRNGDWMHSDAHK